MGASLLASLAGLIVGAVGAAVVGAVLTMLRPGIEYASLTAFLVAPVVLFLEGLLWATLGGALFVFPIGVVALAWLQPSDTHASAGTLTAVLTAPIVVLNYPNRTFEAVLLAVPIWVAVRVALRVFWRLMGGNRLAS